MKNKNTIMPLLQHDQPKIALIVAAIFLLLFVQSCRKEDLKLTPEVPRSESVKKEAVKDWIAENPIS